MIPRKTHWIAIFLALSLGLGLFAVPAQARNVSEASGSIGGEKLTGELLISVQRVGGVHSTTNIVLYDKDWKALDEISTRGGSHRFSKLDTGAYHVVAYADDVDAQASADTEVQSRQTAVVALKLENTSSAGAKKVFFGACGSGVSGDGNIVKVSGYFGPAVVYLQCGRVVAEFGGGGCSCGGGNWRYVNDCTRQKPIYVKLPCPRGRN
jgi:hypothetical protein